MANEKLNISNLEFFYKDASTVKGKYDAIVMAGVLEHIDEPFSLIDKLIKENLNKGGKIITASPSFLNPRGYVWMTLQMLLDVPMSLSDIHFFSPSDFNNYAKSRGLKVSMFSIDHDWGGGDRTILDFKKRLVNALKDKGLNNQNVPEFLEWLKESIAYFNHDDNSGAITISLTGGDGGKLKNISKFNVNINDDDMLTIETGHVLICHLLTTLFRSNGKPMFEY